MAIINGVIGGHPDFTVASTEQDRRFALGDHAIGDDGSMWVYCEADEAVEQYDAVQIASDWGIQAVDTTATANAFGLWVGVVPVAFASGDYGWVQRSGIATVNVKTNCSATTQLNSTAVTGYLDDDQTTGAENINGIVTFATITASASTSAILNFPVVGTTLA